MKNLPRGRGRRRERRGERRRRRHGQAQSGVDGLRPDQVRTALTPSADQVQLDQPGAARPTRCGASRSSATMAKTAKQNSPLAPGGNLPGLRNLGGVICPVLKIGGLASET